MSSAAVPVELGLVWAQSRGGVIGAGGALPWHLPEDLAHFRRTTAGSPVIMGRATWESLPERFRPLPGRTNIVLSRQLGFEAPGASVVSGLDAAIELAARAPGGERAWVIGGAQVYAAAIGRADVLVVTSVDVEVEGDALAPSVGPGWTPEGDHPEPVWEVSTTGLGYRFTTYRRSSRESGVAETCTGAGQVRSGSTSVE